MAVRWRYIRFNGQVASPSCLKEALNTVLKRRSMMEGKLSASEAVYGFAGWLTSRKERVCASSTDDSAIWAELVDQFCKANNLETTRENWTDLLTPCP